MRRWILGFITWITLSFEWMLLLYCVIWNSNIELLGHDIKYLFKDLSKYEIIVLLVPVLLILILFIVIVKKRKGIYIDVTFSIWDKELRGHFCLLELIHKYNAIIAGVCIIIVSLTSAYSIHQWKIIKDKYEYLKAPIVVHAMGKIEDDTYTNSLEAFELHYMEGQRIFETDFSVTSDNRLVARHDWGDWWQEGIDEDHIPTREGFLAVPIFGKYTPLSIEDVIELMKTYKDVILITDSKDSDPQLAREEISMMINTAKAMGAEEVLERFVIQIYSPEMFYAVRDLYDFQRYIFTLYAIWDGSQTQFTDICRFCKCEGIKTITMDASRLIKDPQTAIIAKEYELELYVHTVNEQKEALQVVMLGADGIYTDDEKAFDLKIFER